MAPSISVLITNYNYARFLPAAVESVLAQTRPADEIVVVDDGSTDESLTVLQRDYGDRIRVVAKANGGQASSFNAGAGVCSGDLICLLDADDTWHPEKLATVEGAFARVPDAAMLRHELRYLQPDGPRDGELVLSLETQVHSRVVPERTLVDRRFAPTSALTFPRWAWDRLLPLPEDTFRISADGYLFVFAAMLGPMIDLADVLADYRLHGANNFVGAAGSAARVARIELALLDELEARGFDPVVPHHVYRLLRTVETGSELFRRRRRLRRVADAARGTGSPPRRLVHAVVELVLPPVRPAA
jgi:glycosyltransferase involved in cell wall biosynthesis